MKKTASHCCAICLSSIAEKNDLRSCVCTSGVYHKDCIVKWFMKSGFSCPVCRRQGISLNVKLNDFGKRFADYYLAVAVRLEDLKLVNYFLSLSATPNQLVQGLSLLNYALYKGAYEIAQALLKDARTRRNQSLIFAAERGLPVAAVKLLLENGADINFRDKRDGKTALMHAVLGYKRYSFSKLYSIEDMDVFCNLDTISHEVTETLLESGADVNLRDLSGQTALMLAAHDIHLVKVLVRKGAKINSKNKGGGTPLMYAVDSTEVADYLQSLGAVEDGRTGNTSSFLQGFPLAKVKILVARHIQNLWKTKFSKNDVGTI